MEEKKIAIVDDVSEKENLKEEIKPAQPNIDTMSKAKRFVSRLKKKMWFSPRMAELMRKQMKQQKHKRYLDRKKKIKQGNLEHERKVKNGK